MKKIFYTLLICAGILLAACSKKSDAIITPPDTQLRLTITDVSSGIKAAGATVTLYISQTDFDNKTNAYATQTADAAGIVTFTHLATLKYYWYISSGCRDNTFDANSTGIVIPGGTITSLNAGINSVGTLRFVNNFSSPCRIDVNGLTLVPSLAAGTSYSQKMGLGGYTIRVVRLSGGTYDQTFAGTLTCGSILTTIFP